MTRSVLKIVTLCDESKEIYLDGNLIVNANYESHGWSGMEAIESTAVAIAQRLGAKVVESDIEDEEVQESVDSLVTTLKTYLSNENIEVLHEVAEILLEADITSEHVSDRLNIVHDVLYEFDLLDDAVFKLTYVNVPGEFVGATVQVVASSDKETTEQLNAVLIQEEIDVPKYVEFDILFSMKR